MSDPLTISSCARMTALVFGELDFPAFLIDKINTCLVEETCRLCNIPTHDVGMFSTEWLTFELNSKRHITIDVDPNSVEYLTFRLLFDHASIHFNSERLVFDFIEDKIKSYERKNS